MKKAIIIISIVLGIIAMAVGVYFAWKKSRQILTPPAINQQQSLIDNQQLPPLPEKKMKILSDQPVFDYWIYQATTTEIFYLNQDGQIFKVKEEGEDEAIVNESLKNIQSVKSSVDGKYVLIKFGDRNFTEISIFNSESKVFEMLPNNTSAAAFSSDGKQLIYLNKNDLFIKDLTGAKPKTSKILSFNQRDFDLQWILPEIVVFVSKPSAFTKSSVWGLNIKNQIFSELIPEFEGVILNWSVDMNTKNKFGLQFNSRLQGREGSLNLINEKGEKQAKLNFLTLPNKCYFMSPQIYCAVPIEIPPKTILPDDYLKKSFYSNDSIYQIDIDKNSFVEIFSAGNPIIDAIRLNVNGGKLLFINRYDNKLYQLELQ